MITDSIEVELLTVDECPDYKEAPNDDFEMVRIDKVIVVKGGMQSGNPSFDIQMTDSRGRRHLAMVSGGIMALIMAYARNEYRN